ncbi:MAG: hypothetical protein H7246_08815 [Phycisphaerae bacterium]|nr:hypothetical protein [Saprospiraceae bacterium]
MKKIIFVLQILLAASCMKEGSCPGSTLICTHTVYKGFRACPDPNIPNQWLFSDCKSYTESFEICDGDTSAWLVEARLFDESRNNDSTNQTWTEFARLYPNECGCK